MSAFYHYHFINLKAHVLRPDPSVLVSSKANKLCWSERGAHNAPYVVHNLPWPEEPGDEIGQSS